MDSEDLVDRFSRPRPAASRIVEGLSRAAYAAAEATLRLATAGLAALVRAALLENRELLRAYVENRRPVLGSVLAWLYCRADAGTRERVLRALAPALATAREVLSAMPELADRIDGAWLARRFREMGAGDDVLNMPGFQEWAELEAREIRLFAKGCIDFDRASCAWVKVRDCE